MGAETAETFWQGWAPYWEALEEHHFGRRAVEAVLRLVTSPVLVVGSGQGVAAEPLRWAGHAVLGVDRSREMVAMARRRRGLRHLCGDGAALPFRPEVFGTVILSSGVVDYGAPPEAVRRILSEALRVLRPGGALLAAYYRLEPELVEVYRRLGVVASGRFHLGRLFEIGETARRSPLRCIGPIARWSGRGLLATTLYWARLGLFRPGSLDREQRSVEAVFAAAARRGTSRQALISAVPESVPFWDDESLRRALSVAGLEPRELVETPDCIVACCPRGGE